MRKVRFLPGLSGKPFGYILHLFFQLLQKEDQSVFKFYLDVEPLGVNIHEKRTICKSVNFHTQIFKSSFRSNFLAFLFWTKDKLL